MDAILRNKIVQTVKSIMGIDISSINGATKINTISEWDSFNNLMLISKFQNEFKVNFSAVEIEETQTIDSLFNLIDKKTKK